MLLQQWYYIVGIAVAACILFGYLTRGLWRNVLVPFSRMVTTVDDLGKVAPVITDIAKEFQKNGGKSMKDNMDTLRSEQVVIKAKVEQIEQDVKHIKTKINL